MRKKLSFNFIVILSLLSLFQCEQAQLSQNGTPAAKVGSSILYVDELENKIPPNFNEDQKKQSVQQLKESWIKQELLAQEAERIGLSHNKDIQQKIRQAQQEVIAQAVRDHWLSNSDSLIVTKAEAQLFYEKNKAQFALQERHVRFRHIQTLDLESSKSAKTALLGGQPFEKVVDLYGFDKTETLNSATIFYPISVALRDYPDLNRYLQVIGINEISPIRLLDGRFHFVQLIEERNIGEHPDLDWILTRITDWLLLEKKRKMLISLERELYLRAEISKEITIYTP